VIGVAHPKWQERPLACVVPSASHKDTLDAACILEPLRSQFARWWIPDTVIFLDEIPKTSVGKFSKRILRERYANHYSEAAEPAR
jgi:fatty-acyl-CoA synthase